MNHLRAEQRRTRQPHAAGSAPALLERERRIRVVQQQVRLHPWLPPQHVHREALMSQELVGGSFHLNLAVVIFEAGPRIRPILQSVSMLRKVCREK
jgi:hypothetical protein